MPTIKRASSLSRSRYRKPAALSYRVQLWVSNRAPDQSSGPKRGLDLAYDAPVHLAGVAAASGPQLAPTRSHDEPRSQYDCVTSLSTLQRVRPPLGRHHYRLQLAARLRHRHEAMKSLPPIGATLLSYEHNTISPSGYHDADIQVSPVCSLSPSISLSLSFGLERGHLL